jgi:hypothetical protein
MFSSTFLLALAMAGFLGGLTGEPLVRYVARFWTRSRRRRRGVWDRYYQN